MINSRFEYTHNLSNIYPLHNVTAKPISAIVKTDKRMILAIRQSMWDLWWTKWHWKLSLPLSRFYPVNYSYIYLFNYFFH
jgi:hypothetical protein